MATGGPPAALTGHLLTVIDVAFNHHGDLLATAAWDNTVRLWNPWSKKLLLTLPASAETVGFSRDDRLLISAGPLETWGRRLEGDREYRVLYGPAGPIWGVDFSPDRRIVACAEQEGVRLWDAAAGEAIAYLPVGHSRTALFAPDGRALITSSTRGLWRWPIAGDTAAPRGCKRIGPPERFPAPAPAGCLYAAQNRDGSVLAAGGWERGGTFADRTYVLRRPGRARLTTFPGHPDAHVVAVSPDGHWVATCAWHGTGVRVWDTRGIRHARDLQRETRAFPSFSPDGKWLVIATPREYRFWEVGTWRPGLRIPREGNSNSPGMTAFSRDGRTLALAYSGGNEVRLVHPVTGRQLATLEGPNPAPGQWFCFSPDGTMLAAAGADGGLQLWDLRRIRARLAAMGLDWEQPPYPSAAPSSSPRPLRMRVVNDASPAP